MHFAGAMKATTNTSDEELSPPPFSLLSRKANRKFDSIEGSVSSLTLFIVAVTKRRICCSFLLLIQFVYCLRRPGGAPAALCSSPHIVTAQYFLWREIVTSVARVRAPQRHCCVQRKQDRSGEEEKVKLMLRVF